MSFRGQVSFHIDRGSQMEAIVYIIHLTQGQSVGKSSLFKTFSYF